VIALLVRVFGARHRRNIAILLASAAGCVLVGGALFAATQHLPVTTGWYWAITTATTVGYGDVTPKTAAGRVIASLTMLTTIPLHGLGFRAGARAGGGGRTAEDHRHDQSCARGCLPPGGRVQPEGGRHPGRAGPGRRAGVLVADVDPSTVERKVHVIRGDPTQEAIIRRALPQEAEQALVTGASDGDVLVSSVLLRKLAPNLMITALVGSAGVRAALQDLGVQQTVSADELIAGTLAKSLEAPHAADMMVHLVESPKHKLVEVDAGALAGKLLSAVRDERDDLVLGLVHDGKFILGVGEDPVVAAGDRLLVAVPDQAGRQRGEISRERLDG
jgi:voltage-gated potassium channel